MAGVKRRTAPVGKGAKTPTAKTAPGGKSSASDQSTTINQLRARLVELKAENKGLKAKLDQTANMLIEKNRFAQPK